MLGAAWLMGTHQEETGTVVTRGGYHCHIGDTEAHFQRGNLTNLTNMFKMLLLFISVVDRGSLILRDIFSFLSMIQLSISIVDFLDLGNICCWIYRGSAMVTVRLEMDRGGMGALSTPIKIATLAMISVILSSSGGQVEM